MPDPVKAIHHPMEDSLANASRQFAVVPSDIDELSNVTRALFVTNGGTVSVIASEDTAPVTWNVPDCFMIPVRVKQVRLTGTTATGIIGLY